MTQQDIRNKIDSNNEKIQELLDPTSFVLNKEVQQLIDENLSYQEGCQHEFQDHVCIYCDKIEGF